MAIHAADSQRNAPSHLGVDYGSKLAGTTAAAMCVAGQLVIWQITPGQDADKWLMQLTQERQPRVLYLDAPLTLPKAYSQTPQVASADFFYRQADRELQAMSPMFIGGLTARAIKLRVQLAENGIGVLETYPTALARLLFPQLDGYKKSFATLPKYTEALQSLVPFPMTNIPDNWHQFDAVLAWLSGYRHAAGEAVLYGEATEGRVIV